MSNLDTLTIRVRVPNVTSGIMQLTSGKLGTGKLGDNPLRWVSIKCETVSVDIARGATDGASSGPEVGTTTLVASGLDLASLPGLRPSMALSLTVNEEPIYRGSILDFLIDGTTLTIVAVDRVSDLQQSPRDPVISWMEWEGYTQTNGEPWDARLTRLLADTGIPYQPAYQWRQPPGQALMASLTQIRSIAEALDLAAASIDGRWWVDRTGTVKLGVLPDEPGNPLLLADDHSITGHVCYVDVVDSWDTRDLVNIVTIENTEATPRGDADTQTRRTFRDVTSVATYGPRSRTVSTCLYTRNQFAPSVGNLAAQLLARASRPRRRVRSVTVDGATAPQTAIDLHTPIDVIRSGRRHRLLIVGLTHTITPTEWKTEIHTTERP